MGANDNQLLEVSRQLGVIQGLLMQEEEAHARIVQKLNVMHERVEYLAGVAEGAALVQPEHAPAEPSTVEDIATVVRIIKRRAAIAAAVAGVAGTLVGGASAGELKAAVQKLIEIFGAS